MNTPVKTVPLRIGHLSLMLAACSVAAGCTFANSTPEDAGMPQDTSRTEAPPSETAPPVPPQANEPEPHDPASSTYQNPELTRERIEQYKEGIGRRPPEPSQR